MQVFRPWVCRVCHGTQILADQLTLFQPWGTNYAHLITTGTPGFSYLAKALGDWGIVPMYFLTFERYINPKYSDSCSGGKLCPPYGNTGCGVFKLEVIN